MPGRDYASIQTELIANGWPGATHCMVVSCLGSESQQLKSCPLESLGRLASLPAPVVMLFFAGADSESRTAGEAET
jgi:hypothetical protein